MEGSVKHVMNQTEAYTVFAELCDQIEKEAKKRRYSKLQLDKTLPSYESLNDSSAVAPVLGTKRTSNGGPGKTGQPASGLHQKSVCYAAVSEKKALPQISQIHPSTALFPKRVNVTKDVRFAQHCVVRKMTIPRWFVFEASWTTFPKEEIFGSFMCVHSSKFCSWECDVYLPNPLLKFLCLPSRRAHLLGSKVMPYLPRFNKPLFHPSISGTFLLRLVVKLLP